MIIFDIIKIYNNWEWRAIDEDEQIIIEHSPDYYKTQGACITDLIHFIERIKKNDYHIKVIKS